MDRERAVELLEGLVSIPSLSGQEAEAVVWLVERLGEAGYERSFVDDAGNAVAEQGATDAPHTVVLLGHIDTVPGQIRVRIEEREGEGTCLFGRGSVDAKGPLAAFVAAGARLGPTWARDQGLRLVVVGAVEEESATSKGARAVAARFDGSRDRLPDACVIGEPSRWNRLTLGYKGRLLLELEGRRPTAHTAGPELDVAVLPVTVWNAVEAFCAEHNRRRESAFERLLPSLRSINTSSDGFEERVTARMGLRLPVGFDASPLLTELGTRIARWSDRSPPPRLEAPRPGEERTTELRGANGEARLTLRGFEPAWRGDSRNLLVRSFLAAIRHVAPADEGPAFVVKTGTSDMNVVAPAWRCPILAYGPGDSRLDHTPHEHVRLEEYWTAIGVLERALQELSEAWRRRA